MGKNRGVGKSCAKQDNSDRGVMPIQPKRILKIIICGICFAACIFFTTCGLEVVYYLPQVPQDNIKTEMNTSATVILPALSESYAVCYKIFYRIYISGNSVSGTINTSPLRSSISPSLESDYNIIDPNTDPTSTTSGTPANTLFANRYFFELELDGVDINNLLSKNGGNITISFPNTQGGYPVLSFNNNVYNLFRSNDLISPEPKGDRSFRNSPDLNDPVKATSNINADVAGRTGLSQRYAYVSMYIVATGIDQTFLAIYSKPTHISIFKLPDN